MTKLTKFKLITLMFLNLKAGNNSSSREEYEEAKREYRQMQHEKHPWFFSAPAPRPEPKNDPNSK